jgi:hypothetical protein
MVWSDGNNYHAADSTICGVVQFWGLAAAWPLGNNAVLDERGLLLKSLATWPRPESWKCFDDGQGRASQRDADHPAPRLPSWRGYLGSTVLKPTTLKGLNPPSALHIIN